jgi:hypothetical protein
MQSVTSIKRVEKKAIDRYKVKVRKHIEQFYDTLIDCLGWNEETKIAITVQEKELMKENRRKLLMKFNILQMELGVAEFDEEDTQKG